MSRQRFAVVGTAGHIDHGKTALVSLLTGVDTDRLKEEKARGISIDLGFAELQLPDGTTCGIVDVPGHERFVKNMLAGACGIDAVMLVIAADEGVMPQTREHADIVRLLGIRHGLVAVTKADMVEPEWLELALESVREYLREQGLGDFPVIPVSSKTGEGKEAVQSALASVLDTVASRAGHGGVRLPVDRSFTVEGFGTVVTGTMWHGTIAAGDRLRVEPAGVEVKVRNVQVHGVDADQARAGQRTAVALPGLSVEQAPRGSWLLSPDGPRPSHMMDVRIQVLKDAAELKRRQRVRFHLGASEILARVIPLQGEVILPGEEALAQLRLEGPAVAQRGDCFVLRTYSPARAFAGGEVLVPAAEKHKSNDRTVLERLATLETGGAGDLMMQALQDGGEGGISLNSLAQAGGVNDEAALTWVRENGMVVLGAHWVISSDALSGLRTRMVKTLEDRQRQEPFVWGTSRGDLKSRLGQVPGQVFDYLLAELLESGEVHEEQERLRAGPIEVQLSESQAGELELTEQSIIKGGFAPPTAAELAKTLGFSVQGPLEYLTFKGGIVRVSPDLYLDRGSLNAVAAWLEKVLEDQVSFGVADLRDRFGMSRKYAVPVLEYFDRQGWTRRQGDVRVAGRRLGGELRRV